MFEMPKRIKIRLTAESIDQAIADITEYKEDILRITRELAEELIADGVNVARMKITNYDAIETGALLGSVEGFFDATTGKGFIKVGTDHAAFVEYGTGVIGENPWRSEKPYSTAEPKPSGWNYDVNDHGDAGWVYGNGHRRWTKGQPPRPFMWETFNELCDKASMMVRTRYNG